MKPPILRNLTKLMLVNGLALFFGLITVSNTLATPAPAQIGQPAIDLRRLAPLQVDEPSAVLSVVPAAPTKQSAAQNSQTSPAAGSLANTSSVTATEMTALMSGTLSQDWGDFDRDGQLDLALGTLTGISIYHNDRGQLTPAITITSSSIYGVRWADLNADGLLELVTVRNTPGANGIYRFTGIDFISYTAFTSPLPLARVLVLSGTRDLIASTSVISTPCTVFQYRRSSSYAVPICIATSTSAGLSAGDFDNDGDSDLVLGSFPNQVKLLINRSGIFTETSALTQTLEVDTALSWPYDFAWGDYDGDGRLDLAAAFPLQRQVRIYHNTGSATSPFTLSGILPTQRFMTPLSIDWGDFNGDGALDLAVADDPPRIYFNVKRSIQAKSEALTLSDQPTNETIWGARAIALNNSDLSLALSGELNPARLYEMVRGHLPSEIAPLATTGAAQSVAWGDANGDGKADLLLGSSSETTPSTLYLNSNGTLTTTGLSSVTSGKQQSVAWGKFNRDWDGQLGIVIGDTDNVGRGRVTVYANWSDGNPRLWYPGAPVGAVALGDFNNDGWLDLLVGTKNNGGSGTLLLYRNARGSLDSSPAFTTSVIGQVQSIAWTDYDVSTAGVGYMDFAVATSNRVYVYRNNQDNTFTPIPIADPEAVNVNTTAVAWGDFDGDSQPELAVGVDGQGVRIYHYENNSFIRQWTSPDSNHTTSLASGDWNNDGRLDLAVGNDGEPDLVYANLSTAAELRLSPLWSSPDTGSTTSVAWGDVNNDGYLDLAVSRRTGLSGIYYNTSLLPWRLPTPPSYLSIARPGRANTAYLYSSSDFLPGYLNPASSTLASTVTVYYTVSNPAGILITNTQLELSLDGGSTWQATHYTGTLVPTQTAASGRAGILIWDARRDQPFSDNALLRLRVVDQAPVGPFQRAASVAVSPPFRARAMTCQWLTGLWIDVQPGHRVQPLEVLTFEAKVSDSSGGIISYTWNLYDGTIKEGTTVYHAYKSKGTYTVTVQAQNSVCQEGPALKAMTVVQVGSNPVVANTYLPIIQRSGTTARSVATERETRNNQRPTASAAAAIGGTTECWPQTVLPSSRPTVAWLTGTIGYYGQPVLNQDGSRFAFWSTANLAGTNSDGNIELYYAQVDRIRSCITYTQITSSTGNVLEGFNLGPAINAPGDRVAFYSDRDLIPGSNSDQNFEIFLARINSNGVISLTQVTSSPQGVNALPTLNANGDRIAFVSDQNSTGDNPDGNQEIFAATLDAAGQAPDLIQVTQTNPDTFNDEPSLSGDGQRVAFVRGGSQTSGIQEIFVGNANIPNSPPLAISASPTNVLNYRPTIGGNGSLYSVAYATTDLTQEIVNFATVAGASVNVTPVYTTTRNSLPALNATDGSRLVVISGTQHINVLVPGSHSIRPIYSCAGTNCPYAAISGDGMHVLFTSKRALRESYYETATLSILLNQSTVPVVAGTKLTRTFTLINTGPSLADSVEFSSTLRADDTTALSMTFTTNPAGICSGSDPVYCQIPGLVVNSPAYITLTTNRDIGPGRLDPITFTVDANAWQANQTATISPSANVAVVAQADLRIAKVVNTTGVAGELVTYTLTITNDGPSHARNVILIDQLPNALIPSTPPSWVSGPTFTLTSTAGTITGTIDLLRRNEPATIRVVAELSSTARVGQLISNTGVITSSTSDLISGNNLGRADFIVTTRSELTVTKSAPVTITAGLSLTYNLIVTNTGPSATFDIVLTDSLPPSMTVSTVPTNCSKLNGDTQLVCNHLPLDKGESYTITFAADTDSDIEEATYLTNTVEVSTTNAVKVVSNTATTQTGIGSYLYISKTATAAVTAGEPLTYTIRVENQGPSRAWGLTLTDLWPTDSISYTGSSIDGNDNWFGRGSCNYTIGKVICYDSNGINNGKYQLYYLYATTYQTLPLGASIVNTAGVTSTTNIVSKFSTATTNIDRTLSRLTAAKSADATVLAGNSVHYTIVVTNSGPSYAPFVTVTDKLPTGVTFASSPNDCAPVGGNNVECHVSNLYVGAAQRQTVTLIGNVSYLVDSGTRLTNTAEITASNAAAGVNVTATTTVRTSSILTIEKRATNAVKTVTDPFALGEIVTYTIVVTNNGPSLARNVVLTDRLPVSVTYLSQLGANPLVTPTVSGQTLTWSLNTIAPTATVAVTFNGQITAGVVGSVTLINTAYVTATTAPMTATDTASTDVLPRVRLALTKTLLTPLPIIGDTFITYQVVLLNLGPSIMESATITDDLSEAIILDPPVNGPDCNEQGYLVTCPVPQLMAGQSHTVTISANVGGVIVEGTVFTNTAFATSTIAVAPVNHTVVTTATIRANLRITKTLSSLGTTAIAGENITYTIMVGNTGPSTAPTVTLTDTLPTEVNYISTAGCNGLARQGQVLTCTLTSLAARSARPVTIIGRLPEDLSAGLVITNRAVATATVAPAIATSTLTTTIRTLANLQIDKLANTTAYAGDPLTYTVIVTNAGPSTILAGTLFITDRLPSELTSHSASSVCSEVSSVITCTRASLLAVGSSWSITASGKINSNVTATFTNTAYATSTIAVTRVSDLVPTTVATNANLAITAAITPTNVVTSSGGPVRITFTFTNAGPSDARSVFITGTLGTLTYTAGIQQPAYVSGPVTDTNCGGSGRPQQCVWSISTLTANLSGMIMFTATVPITSIPYSQGITAYITSTLTPDLNPADNTSPSANLTIARVFPGIYWAGLLPIRWPVMLLGPQSHDFWALSP